ncbi:MAG: hypothetical protein HY791_11170 [Deltaproteobacteria bacterium]|nr:hypothetical protein [Deltaproteobacteria bacterium]
MSKLWRTEALLLLTFACAEERAPINRVQPNAIDKALLVGDLSASDDDPEFYMRTTVVDSPMGAADGLFTASDSQPTVRVRWEISENYLIARLTYELIEDSDHRGARRAKDGQPVAAYAIQSHFDIRHDYNATTGEEVNVLVENDSDRPWNERQYFRVDWSKNQVTDAYELDTLSQIGIYYGVKFEPVAYYVNDPSDPNAPVFDLEAGYFDVTLKVLASPQIIHDEEWGDFPACWLIGEWPASSCNPSEVTLRQSFRRVVDTDYEPLDYDGAKMDLFGLFTVDRFGYDRRYGVVDDRWHRFAARWNIWDRSHVSPVVSCGEGLGDPHLDANADGTEDACAAVGRGSRCDAFRGECTLPYRDRRVKTIPWYTNQGFPEDLFEGAKAALTGWSEGLRVAVQASRISECRRTKESDCELGIGWPEVWRDDYVPAYGNSGMNEVPRIFVLCHNPVDPGRGDDPACGPAGLRPRVGDLRYNVLNLIQEPQLNSPWGIMVDAEDPLTGEKIAGSANEWGAVLDLAASNLVTELQLFNGEIRPDEFIAGEDVSAWVAASSSDESRRSLLSKVELDSRRAAFDPKKLEPFTRGLTRPRPNAPSKVIARERARALADRTPGSGNTQISKRLQALRGTQLEAKLVSPEMLAAAGVDPTGAVSADAIQRASPFGRMSPAFRRKLARQESLERAKRHACRIQDLSPDNLLGLAKKARKLFPAPDPNDAAKVAAHRRQLFDWARQQFSMSVLSHELGHSMGLRHNFAGTFDSLNYRAGYWQLRTNNGKVTTDCPEGTVDGSSCVGPRWRDPYSVEELEENIGQYASSSVMDYPGDQNHDMILEGKYDRAALRFAYAQTTDVWATPGVSVTGSGDGKVEAYRLSGMSASPGLFGTYDFPPIDPTQPYERFHYSQYQRIFRLIDQCAPSAEPDAVLGEKCKEKQMDVADYRDLSDFVPDPAYAQYSWANTPKAIDPFGRVRRGYLFSSDEFSDSGNVPSFSYDAGADAYEQVRFLEQAYENRYLMDYFRRNRVRFNSWDVTARVQGHYLDNIQQLAKTFAFAAVLYSDGSTLSASFLDDGRFGPLELASTVALDLFARMMTRPEPGLYCDPNLAECPNYNPTGVTEDVYATDTAPAAGAGGAFEIPIGIGGRYIHNDFDYAQGYWWSDYQTQVGAYYDKIWATYYLAEAYDNFISNSKEDFTDGRYKNLNFASVFPEQVRRLYSGLFTGDAVSYAPWVVTSGSDQPLVVPTFPDWHSNAPQSRPRGAKLVDPNWAWNEQLYAMVFGAIFFPTDWSNQWVNEARITVLGQDRVDWPVAETYAFYNPLSGMTYRAHSTGTEGVFGVTHQKGIGARMLEWANRLVYVAYLVELDENGRALANPDGTLKLILDPQGRPQLDPETAGTAAVLQKYVENLDTLRELTATFERDL